MCNSKSDSFETFEDIIDYTFDSYTSDCDDVLESFLDKMPFTRESVDKMLDIVSTFDFIVIYNKLLLDCESLLTPEETEELKTQYKRKFCLPLPGEDE